MKSNSFGLMIILNRIMCENCIQASNRRFTKKIKNINTFFKKKEIFWIVVNKLVIRTQHLILIHSLIYYGNRKAIKKRIGSNQSVRFFKNLSFCSERVHVPRASGYLNSLLGFFIKSLNYGASQMLIYKKKKKKTVVQNVFSFCVHLLVV